VEGISVLSSWNMGTCGVCIGDFSTRHSVARRSIGSYPCNIASHVNYCEGSWTVQSDFLNTYSSPSLHNTAWNDTDDRITTLRRYTASVILNSVYDYDVKTHKDELFDIITKTLEITARALRPDVSIIVGAFPARK